MDASQTNSPASTTISGMASRLGQSSSTVMNRPKDNHRAGPTRHVKSPSASSVLPSRPWEQRSSPMSPLAEQPTQTPAPTLSAQDLQSAQVQKGIEYHVPAASSAELASFYANDKLTPFPGLFRPGSETESLLATKPEFQVSAEKQSPRVTQPNKAWSRPLSPESTSSRTVAKSPSFLFSILKKKAPGSGPQVPSPTRRFFDTKHTRSPSRAEEERSEADLPIQIISKEAGNRLADFADLSRTSSLTSSASTTQHGSVENPSSSLSPATTAMIQRYSHLLTSQSAPVPGVSPAAIEDPPRKLLMAAPIFQIVNSSTIKDRFFFVFNDILVIAKPVVAEQEGKDAAAPSLRSNFAVKNIIELHQIKLSDPEEHSPSDPRAPSLMATFVEGFQSDPKGALDKLIRVSGLPNNSSTAAQLLYQTPELDRDRLTKYLCAPERHMTLRAYVGRYRFAGMPLESALRVFLMELRFPTDLSCFEALLQHFASRWTEVNASLIDSRFTPELVMQLVFAIMVLNDSLHSRSNAPAAGCAFSLPNPHISRQEFVAAFRSRDPDLILTDKSLCRIYAGIKAEPLCQALAAHEGPRIEVRLSTQMPSKLAYGLPSEPITISIPAPDPDFAIRLYGQDLEFDPPLLTFERTSLCSFTMVSKNVGPKCVIFARAGRNSRYYSGLPLSRPVNIERAFMRHNFVLTFKNSHGSKRKYMFSVEDSETRRRWIDMLKEQIATSIAVRKQLSSATGGLLSPQARRAAEAVALQVLRDALVISDESLAASLSQDHHYYQKPAPVMLTSNAKPVNRSVSVSRHYYASSGAGRLERELMLNGHGHGDGDVVRTPEANGAGVTGVAKDGSSSPPAPLSAGTVRTGEEVVTTCQQNSLLPLVLSFLQAGLGGEKDKSF